MSRSSSTLGSPTAAVANELKDDATSVDVELPSSSGANDPESNPQVEEQLPSNARRYVLLTIFAMANFLDAFGVSAVFIGLSTIGQDLGMTVAETTWIVNAYSLTLASTLLTAGRVSDIYNAKIVFIVGFFAVGVFSLGVGFAKNQVTLIVLRAMSGLGASLTIPSAINLLVHLFPDPKQQGTALSIFGASGALANVLGLIVGGALLVGGWSWIFWFTTVLATPLSLACIFLIPAPKKHFAAVTGTKEGRQPRMDYIGALLQTIALVLLVFGLTEANINGWKDPATISTVVVGAVFIPLFFLYESSIDPLDALIAPAMWKIPNLTLISVFGLSLGYWFFECQVSFSDIFQGTWGFSGIMTAVRFLPSAIAATMGMMGAQQIPLAKFPLRWRLVVGAWIGAGAMLMFSFVDDPSDYYSLLIPGFILGSAGNGLAFISAYVSLLLSVPPQHSGTTGGIWNSIVQLGAAAFLSITSTIQVSFPENEGDLTPTTRGYKYGFIFAMALMLVNSGLVLVFFVDPLALSKEAPSKEDQGEGEKETSAQ